MKNRQSDKSTVTVGKKNGTTGTPKKRKQKEKTEAAGNGLKMNEDD